ncbi:hypothetical protein RRG08_029852 [Elysia crispata]|uniref:Uncharacterized protein n=1 Tax=Elysia crispata TaxID=231223 RepID=A0AAE1E163_9GAST|nr:hypothetical protein RRG08_029852 [Elysia crispata]
MIKLLFLVRETSPFTKRDMTGYTKQYANCKKHAKNSPRYNCIYATRLFQRQLQQQHLRYSGCGTSSGVDKTALIVGVTSGALVGVTLMIWLTTAFFRKYHKNKIKPGGIDNKPTLEEVKKTKTSSTSAV